MEVKQEVELMDPNLLEEWILKLIEEDKLWKFYKDKRFIALKEDVLKEQRHECQMCGKTADTVHHVQFVRKHPRLALSRYYYFNGQKKRNLIAVCKSCHNLCHPEKRKSKTKQKYINEERC